MKRLLAEIGEWLWYCGKGISRGEIPELGAPYRWFARAITVPLLFVTVIGILWASGNSPLWIVIPAGVAVLGAVWYFLYRVIVWILPNKIRVPKDLE
jgi:hypothetical protein